MKGVDMTISVYCVRYIVDAPPAYKGDPFQRQSTKEKMVASTSAQSAIDFVKLHLDKSGVVYRDITAMLHGPFYL